MAVSTQIEHGKISNESAEIFNKWPHVDSAAEAQRSYLEAVIKKDFFEPGALLGEIMPLKGMNVVDAGCGSGFKSIHMASKGAAKVLGIDAASIAVARATAHAEHFSLGNAIFIESYLENIVNVVKDNFPDGVDYVHNIANIHHVSDPEKLVQDFYSILKSGGCATISWAEPTRGWPFLLKNRFCYILSNNPANRIKIGGMLFGWADKRYNPKGTNLEAWYADLYAAFYAWIPLWKMIRYARSAGFEVLETEPPMNAEHWLNMRRRVRDVSRVEKVVNLPLGRTVFTLLLRAKQFFEFGHTRSIIVRKP